MAYQPREEFMPLAIARAIAAKIDGDYAISAVVVREDKILLPLAIESK
jgi:hypothetical protein